VENAQQPCWQSESDEHLPVTNCWPNGLLDDEDDVAAPPEEASFDEEVFDEDDDEAGGSLGRVILFGRPSS